MLHGGGRGLAELLKRIPVGAHAVVAKATSVIEGEIGKTGLWPDKPVNNRVVSLAENADNGVRNGAAGVLALYFVGVGEGQKHGPLGCA
jgi:hypothetical protein